MSKLVLCILSVVFLSGCATMGNTYSEKTATAQTCIENGIVAVLGVAFKGPEVFEKLCEKRN